MKPIDNVMMMSLANTFVLPEWLLRTSTEQCLINLVHSGIKGIFYQCLLRCGILVGFCHIVYVIIGDNECSQSMKVIHDPFQRYTIPKRCHSFFVERQFSFLKRSFYEQTIYGSVYNTCKKGAGEMFFKSTSCFSLPEFMPGV